MSHPVIDAMTTRQTASTSTSNGTTAPATAPVSGSKACMSLETHAIFNEPALIIKRPSNVDFHFLQVRDANVYEIFNKHGELLGCLKERGSGVSGFLKRNVLSLTRPFVMDLEDVNGNVLMSFKRGFTTMVQKSDIKVYVDGEKGDEIVIGDCLHSLDLMKKKYTLSVVNENGEMKEFSKIESELFKWKFPLIDSSGLVLAEVCHDVHDLEMQLLSDDNVYILKMDKTAYKNEVSEFGAFSEVKMTVAEKAVMFASVLSIDFNYFGEDN